ncbi:hypothetical protein M427DRAFT_74158 [Gonapodya prolifera JEL478]|uniref:SH3 domain-containing protein n=1 Tax=Gonapodya prolifera (strain JEL478) TaxID=1344416 RepID=A0A139A1Y5_GONPJ|nr:hypothetical protein M427DRAFT_74158 [Gonapodya prolifera JEL478]|eukprot:KXS10373.1 hypothetical protein M427DRAFT_74158 [Gonapodya prolifera JEL478]
MYIEVNHKPCLDMVATLLKHGGPFLVTPDLYAAVKTMPDKRFIQLMEHSLNEGMELTKDIIRPPPASDELTILHAQVDSLTTQLQLTKQTLQSQLAKATSRIFTLERTVAILQQSGSASHQPQTFPLPIDVKKVMHVVTDYAPLQGDEIELVVGQMVFCNLQYHDRWGQGMNTITGTLGYFPMLHVSFNLTPSPSAPPFTTRMDSIKHWGAAPSPPLSQHAAAAYTQSMPSGSYRRQTPPSTRMADVRGPV